MGNKRQLLFMDDRSRRIHAALEKYSGDFDVTIVPSVLEALRSLSKATFDVISLDHDLNGQDFMDPDDPLSGMALVRYLEKTGWPVSRKRPDVWIHSSNLFAGHLMVARLRKLGFSALFESFRYDNGGRNEKSV